GVIPFQHDNWWTLPRPLSTSTWVNHVDANLLWHNYPRTFLLCDDKMLTAGSAIICETPFGGATSRYGGGPVRILNTSSSARTLTEDAALDSIPSEANATVGGWNYSNGVLMHTLHHHTYDEVTPLAHYDLNRILMSGGSREIWEDADTV